MSVLSSGEGAYRARRIAPGSIIMDASQILLSALISLGCILGIATAATALQWINDRERSRSGPE
jgi:hypothetical protein